MRRLRLWWVAGAGLIALVLLGYAGDGALRVWQMKREVEALEREIRQLRSETDCLARAADRLRDDPAQIEKLAREQLGFVKKGERVLKFPPTSGRDEPC